MRNQIVAHIFATDRFLNDIIQQEMVEAFKTNVQKKAQSKILVCVLQKKFPSLKINLDLWDCDKVLRIEGDEIEPSGIMVIIKDHGFNCELLH